VSYQRTGVDFTLSVEQQFGRPDVAAVCRDVQWSQVVLMTHNNYNTTIYAPCEVFFCVFLFVFSFFVLFCLFYVYLCTIYIINK